MFRNIFLDILFLAALVSMWTILLYHSYLVVMCYNFFIRGRKKMDQHMHDLKYYPFVSIIVPAHNEEAVIERTVLSLLELQYPPDRYEVIVVNDESTDATKQILDRYAENYRRIKPVHIPDGEGRKGKAHALNLGIRKSQGEVIAIYDADNSPEPDSLKYLIAELNSNDQLAAVCGKVRTQNRKKNLLTRFINIEFIFHQWIAQAGRWYSQQITMIPGTNFVIRKKILEEAGSWDEKALTEDMELTLRILDMGYLIGFNPFAITWEQEPEDWNVWYRQRMRWLKGNQYIVRKYAHWSQLRFKNRRQMGHILYMMAIYAFMLLAVIISDALFILGVLNITQLTISGPLLLTWFLAFLIFVIGISVTLSFEETAENTIANVGYAVLMYFTYCQLWVLLSVRSLFVPFEKKTGKPFWAKTPRVRLDQI